MFIILIEKVINKIKIKLKIMYWKLKYGKRIQIGKNLCFRKRLDILIEKNGYLKIGDNNFFNNDCSINCLENITIGNDNIFGENVKIYDHNHIFNTNIEELKNKFKTNKITIGNANWICSNVTILKNAQINNRNVIGAGVIINEKIESEEIIKKNNKLLKEKIELKGKK